MALHKSSRLINQGFCFHAETSCRNGHKMDIFVHMLPNTDNVPGEHVYHPLCCANAVDLNPLRSSPDLYST